MLLPLLKRVALAALLGAALGTAALAAALADAPKPGFAPDPPGHPDHKQWVFDVAAFDGKPSIEKVRPVTLEMPAETRRMMGRFAIELYVGPELLDRIRFNIPLMGDGPQERNPRHPFPRPGFEHVTTRLRVQMADNPRAAYAVLVDRATGDSARFAWPPDADGHLAPWRAPPAGDAGAWPGPTRDGGPASPLRPDAGPADASTD
jgi:hypothetical protein